MHVVIQPNYLGRWYKRNSCILLYALHSTLDLCLVYWILFIPHVSFLFDLCNRLVWLILVFKAHLTCALLSILVPQISDTKSLARDSIMCKVYIGYHGTSEIEHGCVPVWSIIPLLKLRDYLYVQVHKPCSISHLYHNPQIPNL